MTTIAQKRTVTCTCCGLVREYEAVTNTFGATAVTTKEAFVMTERQERNAFCKHKRTTIASERCYQGPVARPPYTDEDRRAHGAITVTVSCDDCGVERLENRNGGAVEVSPWESEVRS